jgi:hypothetical protein
MVNFVRQRPLKLAFWDKSVKQRTLNRMFNFAYTSRAVVHRKSAILYEAEDKMLILEEKKIVISEEIQT